MKKLLLATVAAVALCAAALPAHAMPKADSYWCNNPGHCETTQEEEVKLNGRGLTNAEEACLVKFLPYGRDRLAANPITDCGIPASRTLSAMNALMGFYRANHGRAATAWVEAHCVAKPAIPHNTWECTDNGFTWEYE